MTAWLDELDLDPEGAWLRMGTRTLGDRPWVFTAGDVEGELAQRRELIETRAPEVLAEPAESLEPARELVQLVVGGGLSVADGPSPLRRLGVSLQEDFCLLERSEIGWDLRAAVLCFPSRWRLRDKIDRPLTDVHGPVEGYADALADRVNRLIDGLGDRIVLRRNWFLHPDPSLFQPDRPAGGDPTIGSESCGSELHVRSERQTLRLLPQSQWCVFTIRIEQCSLGDAVNRRPAAFSEWISNASSEHAEHRGVTSHQRSEVREWLGRQTASTT